MDEEQFKQLKSSATQIECPFEKSIQQRRYDCRLAKRFNIGEREAVACVDEDASQRCRTFLRTLRDKAGFAMGRKDSSVTILYNRLMQLQLGGLEGLSVSMPAAPRAESQTLPPLPDIASLLDAAEKQYGDVEAYPYSEIMRTLVHTRVRASSRHR